MAFFETFHQQGPEGKIVFKFIDDVCEKNFQEFQGIKLQVPESKKYGEGMELLLKITQRIIDDLKGRFSQSDLMKNYESIEINHIRKRLNQNNLPCIGKEEILFIAKGLNMGLNETKINLELLDQEFLTLKNIMLGEGKKIEKEEIYEKIQKANLLNVFLVYQSLFLLLLSTASCERAFSRMNLIKTDIRNMLQTQHLDDLMFISTNGSDISNFKADRAIQIWKNIKNRYFA